MNSVNVSRKYSPFFYITKPTGIVIIFFLLLLAGCNFPDPETSALVDAGSQQTGEPENLTPNGLVSPTVLPHGSLLPAETPSELDEGYIHYTTQQGDTVSALASRFNVPVEEIHVDFSKTPQTLLPIGLELLIPDILGKTLICGEPLLPDSEVIYGASVDNFDATSFALEAGGFLATYMEVVDPETMLGPDIVQRVAIETSTNPRLLLAFLEYRSGWVYGFPEGAADDLYPLGYGAGGDTGLYKELMITAKLLSQGFYGWREGNLVELKFFQGESQRLPPGLNAGSVALMHLFAGLYTFDGWDHQLCEPASFINFYQNMFGNYWDRATKVEPYLSADIQPPILALPFAVGETWSFTGGPHITWQTGTPWGALDFAPVTGESHCAVSIRWVTAAAPGLIVRSERSVVALDLDGDGDEGTGWVLVYHHVAAEDRLPVGAWVEQDASIGHPSCEGGQASGTHLHFARKFNGEWQGVEAPFPLILSGWQVFADEKPYQGFLQKGDDVINASPCGCGESLIMREE